LELYLLLLSFGQIHLVDKMILRKRLELRLLRVVPDTKIAYFESGVLNRNSHAVCEAGLAEYKCKAPWLENLHPSPGDLVHKLLKFGTLFAIKFHTDWETTDRSCGARRFATSFPPRSIQAVEKVGWVSENHVD
jgi:hypothetical protein